MTKITPQAADAFARAWDETRGGGYQTGPAVSETVATDAPTFADSAWAPDLNGPEENGPAKPDYRALLEMAVEALEAWQTWEADIIINGDWRDEMPRLTQAQYDRMIELQEVRSSTLATIKTALEGK